MRIVLTGGGTGGHLIPLAPIIEALRVLHIEQQQTLPKNIEPEELDIHFLGIADDQTKAFFAHYDIRATHIPSGKLRRYFSPLTVTDLLFRLPLGIVIALLRLWWLMPEVVISKGGYGSFPVTLAAVFYRIPVLLHESDTVVGLANRVLARFSSTIAVSYEQTRAALPQYAAKVFFTGTPVRHDFSLVTPHEARQFFGFSDTEHVLLVMGGSQGSSQLNEVLLQALPTLILDMAVIHLTGKDHYASVQAVASELLASSSRQGMYKVYPYLDEKIAHALVAADVVVSRAGQATLSELASLGKAVLLVPLASAASDHQRYNAQLFMSAGAARVLDPTNLNRSLFEHNIRLLMDDPAIRQQLEQAIRTLYVPDAARRIATLAFKLVAGLEPRALPEAT